MPQVVDTPPTAPPSVDSTTRHPIARWAAGVLFVMYGFAKITHSQFTVLDSQLTKPMGEVSGFWLTWYYFGYSTAYETFVPSPRSAAASC